MQVVEKAKLLLEGKYCSDCIYHCNNGPCSKYKKNDTIFFHIDKDTKIRFLSHKTHYIEHKHHIQSTHYTSSVKTNCPICDLEKKSL